MKTSTVVVLGVVAVAGIGGFLYLQHSRKASIALTAKAPSSSGGSTGGKVLDAINAGIPLATKILDKIWEK